MRLTRRGVALAALSLLWAALLFWESSRPNPFPFLPEALLSQDKLLHAGAYAVLGALLAAALRGTRLGSGGRGIVLAVVLAAAYGATDEWHQSFVPGRTADRADWAADVVGGIAGASAVAFALRRRGARLAGPDRAG